MDDGCVYVKCNSTLSAHQGRDCRGERGKKTERNTRGCVGGGIILFFFADISDPMLANNARQCSASAAAGPENTHCLPGTATYGREGTSC